MSDFVDRSGLFNPPRFVVRCEQCRTLVTVSLRDAWHCQCGPLGIPRWLEESETPAVDRSGDVPIAVGSV